MPGKGVQAITCTHIGDERCACQEECALINSLNCIWT